MGYSGKNREEEIQELFIKNRINKRLKRKIKFFNMFSWLSLGVSFVLGPMSESCDNIIFFYICIGSFLAWMILTPIFSLTLIRCPYCGAWIAWSLRVGTRCAKCGEDTEYHKSLEDMEMKRNLEKEW